jgi:hypothetical protein
VANAQVTLRVGRQSDCATGMEIECLTERAQAAQQQMQRS